MSKETRLNIRITPAFQQELKQIASYHGLTVSSYVHSSLVQRLRQEREANPQAFAPTTNDNGEAASPQDNGKIIGLITPQDRTQTKADARRLLERDAELLDSDSKPRKLKHLGDVGERNAEKKRKAS